MPNGIAPEGRSNRTLATIILLLSVPATMVWLSVVLLQFFDVILRTIVKAPMPGGFELLVYVASFAIPFAFPAAVFLIEDARTRRRAPPNDGSGRPRPLSVPALLDIVRLAFADIVQALILALLGYVTAQQAIIAYSFGERTQVLGLPGWLPLVFSATGFGLAAVASIWCAAYSVATAESEQR